MGLMLEALKQIEVGVPLPSVAQIQFPGGAGAARMRLTGAKRPRRVLARVP